MKHHNPAKLTKSNFMNPLISSLIVEVATTADDELLFLICQKLGQLLNSRWSALFSVNSERQTFQLEAVCSGEAMKNLMLQTEPDRLSFSIASGGLTEFRKKNSAVLKFAAGKSNHFIPEQVIEIYQKNQADPVFYVPFTKAEQLIAVGIVQLENIENIDHESLLVFNNLAAEILARYFSQKRIFKIEERFRNVVDKIGDAVIFLDQEMKIVFWNKAAEIMFGYQAQEILAKPIFTILTKRENGLDLTAEANLTLIPDKKVELIGIKKNGSQFPIELFLSRSESDSNIYATIFVHELTENKLAEDRFKAAINEKVTLLQEIHHRVKNNLQTISSLLYLQSKYFEDSKSQEFFKSFRNRIQAMSLLYEKLYRSADFITIYYFKDYIADLIRELSRSYKDVYHKIKFDVQIDNFALIVDRAVPFGLILNELISNTLKHAYPDNWQGAGEVKIEIRQTREGLIRLEYHDNGIGLPKKFALDKVKSLGLKLVKNLVELQLEGTMEISVDKGTTFYINFKG